MLGYALLAKGFCQVKQMPGKCSDTHCRQGFKKKKKKNARIRIVGKMICQVKHPNNDVRCKCSDTHLKKKKKNARIRIVGKRFAK